MPGGEDVTKGAITAQDCRRSKRQCWRRLWLKKSRSGSPRLTLDLVAVGHRHDRKNIAKCLSGLGLRAKAVRKFKVTTGSGHGKPTAPNLLNQEFHASAPNQKWVGDITYLHTDEGWLYLAYGDRICTLSK
jgi:transposase InsO family protein